MTSIVHRYPKRLKFRVCERGILTVLGRAEFSGSAFFISRIFIFRRGYLSLLFKQVDPEGTCDNVVTLLSKDLERLLLMSGRRLTDLKSPRLTGMPSGSYENQAEDIIINGLNAESTIEAIHATIYHLPEPSKKIILGLFVDHHQWFVVSRDIYSGHTKLGKLRKKALLEFADAYDYWERKYQVEPIKDLHEYKDE